MLCFCKVQLFVCCHLFCLCAYVAYLILIHTRFKIITFVVYVVVRNDLTEWILMLLVLRRNKLTDWLTLGQLLIDISCHLISPRFSFAHSSCLIPPFPPRPSLLESRLSRLTTWTMPKMIHCLLLLCVKLLGKGHQGIIFRTDSSVS